MASKSAQQHDEVKIDVEETLEQVDKTLERVKSLYEQYFLGIQKQPPTFLHTDLDRKLRDLAQIQIRNTALRYRFVTLQQKFGSYHSYWRRTLRQIENGTYSRSLSKLGRKAAKTGEEIPEEILAAMPKRMREQVRRDREAALALAKQRNQLEPGTGDFYEDYDTPAPVARVDSRGAHLLDAADADLDLDAYFKQVEEEEAEAAREKAYVVASKPREPEAEPDPFENIMTPPRPTTPSAPAPLRASTLGFGPSRTTSPNMRVPQRPATDPGTAPTPSAPSRPAFRQSDTNPGTGGPQQRASTEVGPGTPPARISQPMAAQPRQTQPFGSPMVPQRNSQPMAAQPAPQQPAARISQPMAAQPPARISQPMAAQPTPRQTQPLGSQQRDSQPMAAQPTTTPPQPPTRDSQPIATQPNRTGALPAIPRPGALPPIPQPNRDQTQPLGRPAPQGFAPSQVTRPNPIAAGAASQAKPATVETMQGPFAREPSTYVPPRRDKRDTDMEPSGDAPKAPTPQPQQPSGRQSRPMVPPARPTPTPRPQPTAQRPSQPAQRPPPGMTDDDVKNLYAKYVKAKEMVGEATGPQTYGKLLNTINAQAPKIMEQYKAKGVDFSVVVKDNQVIIRAKPKT